MSVSILIADADYAATTVELAPQFSGFHLVCATANSSAAELAKPDFVGLIAQSAAVDSDLLQKLSGLRCVLKLGRSYHNIDVDAVRARGLTFASAPRKGPNCVAELALTLILSLSKDLIISHESVKTGAYRLRGLRPEITAQMKMAFHWMRNMRVHEVAGKSLGIVGMGEIGCELARRASVLGMRTLYYKRTPLSPELERRFDAEYRPLEALLQESDYVCLATPHTDETEHMIGADELALMKPTAFLINISRGGVIDEEALIDALRDCRIAGAGLDVFTYEPLPTDSPLCHMNNVILTPHIGGGSGTNRTLELTDALREMERILNGEAPIVSLNAVP